MNVFRSTMSHLVNLHHRKLKSNDNDSFRFLNVLQVSLKAAP